jgi:hypothetical protein
MRSFIVQTSDMQTGSATTPGFDSTSETVVRATFTHSRPLSSHESFVDGFDFAAFRRVALDIGLTTAVFFVAIGDYRLRRTVRRCFDCRRDRLCRVRQPRRR